VPFSAACHLAEGKRKQCDENKGRRSNVLRCGYLTVPAGHLVLAGRRYACGDPFFGGHMNMILETESKPKSAGARRGTGTAFGCPREFLGNHFVYVVISARARGLSVGVNLTPDKQCNFDCPYCEVDRLVAVRDAKLDLDAMSAELQATLDFVHAGKLRAESPYASVPPDLLRLRHVAISGDGEPTLCPQFREAVETVIHVRARAGLPFFKIVLLTNASNLDAPEVQEG
jgi:hypothetical protein